MQKNKSSASNIFFRVGQIALVMLAAFFIVFGILRGEGGVVLKKAIRICMECIGLG